jgi:hypothetical protein
MTIEELFDDDILLRRLSPESHFKKDRVRVTRGASRIAGGYDPRISVQVQRLLPPPNDPTQILDTAKQHWGIGKLVVRDVKALGFDVRHDPLPGDDAHALIVGETDQELAERLVELLEVIKWPTEPDRPSDQPR